MAGSRRPPLDSAFGPSRRTAGSDAGAPRGPAGQAPHEQVEVERYELFAGPRFRFSVDRREFLKLATGGAVILIAAAEGVAQESGGGRRTGSDATPAEVSAWLKIDPDGRVTAFTGKVEIGQNARTSLTQAIVEELRVPVASVSLVMGDTGLTPFDMGTFGSRTTPIMGTQLRRAAAAAREALIDLAAARWQVDRRVLMAEDGRVREVKGTRSSGYGELAEGQALVRAIPANVEIIPPHRWQVSGSSLPKVNGRDVVTGRHRYTSDMTVDGMLHGKVLRPLKLADTLASLDASAAEQMPGVSVVRDGDFVGVTAPTIGQAVAARNALKAKWRTSQQPSSRDLVALLRSSAKASPRGGPMIDEGLKGAARVLEATYTIAYIAHAPLEPRAAVASWSEGRSGS